MGFLARAGAAIKSALRFPAYGGQGVYSGGIYDWMTWQGGQGYDYREAAGPLHRNGTVMACAAWIMRAFPEPPVQVIKEDAAGEDNEVPKHPLTRAFRKPNPFYGADCLWQRVIFDRSLHGQAYIYKIRNGDGDVIALYHVPQHRIIPQWDPSGTQFIDHYILRVDARQEKIPIQDLVHFRFGGDPDHERSGLASLGAGLREIGALNEGSAYRGQILRNMGVPSHLLQGKDPTRPINADQAEDLHRKWAERVSGGNRGKPIIPNWAMEAIKLGYSPEELDLGNMLDEPADLVCALFGLSSMVVGLSSGTEHRTYANYKEARAAATETALIPAWKQIGQDLTLQLLPDYEHNEDECVTFNLTNVRVLQEDHSATWNRVVNAYQAEIIDRYRALQGLGLKPEEADKGIYYQKAGGIDAPGTALPPGTPSPASALAPTANGNGNGNGRTAVGAGR
jgi:HK97 family phage portal protein